MYELALELLEVEMTNPDGSEADVVEAAANHGGGGGGGGDEPPQRACFTATWRHAGCGSGCGARRWRRDAACDLQPHYTKALYRRAQAKRALREPDGALEDAALAHGALPAGRRSASGGGGAEDGGGDGEVLRAVKEEVAKEKALAVLRRRSWV